MRRVFERLGSIALALLLDALDERGKVIAVLEKARILRELVGKRDQLIVVLESVVRIEEEVRRGFGDVVPRG